MAIVTYRYDQDAAQQAAQGGGARTLLPPGDGYVVRVTSFTVKPPKQQGKFPQLELDCTIMRSPDGQNLNRTTKRWLSLSPKAIPYFVEPFLKAAGIPYQFTQQGEIQFDDAMLTGATTQVECRHEADQNGNMRDRLQNDRPVESGQPAAQAAPPPMQAQAPQGYAQPPAAPPQAPPQQGGWSPQAAQQAAQPAPQAPPAGQWPPPGFNGGS